MLTPVFDAPKHIDIAERVGDPRLPLAPHVARHLGVKLTPQEIERAEDDIDYLGIMRDPEARTDAAIFDAAIGSLGVLGYGRAWLACAFGVDERHLQPGQGQVKPYGMHLALAAAIRIGSRWATPESTGQTAQQIEDVQQDAIDRGFRAPAAYDCRYKRETKRGLPKSTDRPRVRSNPEDIAKAKVLMLAYFCARGGTEASLGGRFGLSTRTVGRARNDEIGLRVVIRSRNTLLDVGQDDLMAAIFKAANAVEVGDDARAVYAQLRAFVAERAERLATAAQAPIEVPVAA